MSIAFTALSGSRFWSRHVLRSGPKLQNTNCTEMFSTAATRHKQQTSGRLRTANNTLVKCFFQSHAPDKLEISALTECELKRFSGAFRAGAQSPLACLPRTRPFSLSLTTSKRLPRRLTPRKLADSTCL